jgi:hypothetical protein
VIAKGFATFLRAGLRASPLVLLAAAMAACGPQVHSTHVSSVLSTPGSASSGPGTPSSVASSSSPNGDGSAAARSQTVALATPPGWLPVTYGDAQLSVPSSWSLVSDGASTCGPTPGVVILGSGQWCPPHLNVDGPVDTPTVAVKSEQVAVGAREHPAFTVNGIPLYRSTPGTYDVPVLGVVVTVGGRVPSEVLRTLTFSPRATVLHPGPATSVPSSWRWISFAHLRAAVPSSWDVVHATHAPPCATDVVLVNAGVVQASQPALPLPCALPMADVKPVPPVAGVEVDDFPVSPESSACVGPRSIGGLQVCIDAAPAYGILVAQVSAPGHDPITFQLGLFGDGTVDRTILYSLGSTG